MTIKTKLSLNAVVVLAALSIIIVSALISARTVDRNVSELTQRTAPYQLRALNQQRELQAHATNLVNLSTSRNMDEYAKSSAGVSASLGAVNKASEEMARLKGERSGEDKTISEITQGFQGITERKIKAQEAVLSASKSIQERLEEVTKRLDAFVRSLQQKNSGSMITGVDHLMAANQQLNSLNLVRDGLKDLNFYIMKIPVTNDKRGIAALRDNTASKIKFITQILETGIKLDRQDSQRILNEMYLKLKSLNDEVIRPLIIFQLKYINE